MNQEERMAKVIKLVLKLQSKSRFHVIITMHIYLSNEV